MKRIRCIICDKPAVHTCENGNTLCAGHLAAFRNNSVPPASPLSGESASAACSAPGPRQRALQIGAIMSGQPMTGAHHRLSTTRANTPRDSIHLPSETVFHFRGCPAPAVHQFLIGVGLAVLFLSSAFFLFLQAWVAD
jgi:hypothetical protein